MRRAADAGPAGAEPAGEPACANCGAARRGRWCHACGQDGEAARTDSLRGFLRENLGDLVHLDSRGLRTLRDLIVRPGSLTAAYFEGRRVRYLSAVQIYLITAALFFFVSSMFPFFQADGASWSADGAIGIMTIGEQLDPDERAPLIARGITSASFEQHLQSTSSDLLPAFLIGVVVAFAVFVAAMYPLRERNLLKHTVFALHWTAFYLLLAMLERLTGRVPGEARFTTTIIAAAGLAWLALALRTAYGQSWKAVVPKAFVLFIAFHALLALWIAVVFTLATRAA